MILFIIYVVLSSAGLLLVKMGSADNLIRIQNSIFSFNMSLTSMLGMLCYLISFLLWMVIVSKSQISYIVPLGVAFTNLAILLGSVVFLHETLTIKIVIGAALIVLGVFVMQL